MKTFFILVLSLSTILFAEAQEIIELKNPSFEAPHIKTCCRAPNFWIPCGERNRSSPDVQPGHYNVDIPPIDGKNYISMVTRASDDFEVISQQLKTPLYAGEQYWFSIALARSAKMESPTEGNSDTSDFSNPVKLQIRSGSISCRRTEILSKSPTIENTKWEYYEFILSPKRDVRHIIFEAFFKNSIKPAYNGNILMDHCSPIVHITPTSIAEIEKIRKERDFKTPFEFNFDFSKEEQLAQDFESLVQSQTGQIDSLVVSPVTWRARLTKKSGDLYKIEWVANIKDGWRMYSQHNKNFHKEAPNTKIDYHKGNHFKFTCSDMESKTWNIMYSNAYNCKLKSFSDEVVFSRELEVRNAYTPISGTFDYIIFKEEGTQKTITFDFLILPNQEQILMGQAILSELGISKN